eukprot:SM006143S19856  [mRNA]  locus=s6143:2:529:- [translate_table: standard]
MGSGNRHGGGPLAGADIMHLWDHLCAVLNIRYGVTAPGYAAALRRLRSFPIEALGLLATSLGVDVRALARRYRPPSGDGRP